MLVNSSSSSSDQLIYFCSESMLRLYISLGMIVAKAVLVLSLSTFVLYLGHGFWQQQRSFSHSDVFTFHLAVIELFWLPASIGFISGTYCGNLLVITLALCGLSLTFFGEVFFHLLTCVERYLAVVHPVTYLKFKNTRGVRIRNISIGCVWLLCFGLASSHADITGGVIMIVMLILSGFTIIIITFCSVSVLRVLVRPGPGEGVRGKMDQSKQRAFHTITAMSSVLWLWFVAIFFCIILFKSALREGVDCVVLAVVSWFELPTAVVSPMLYLHRTRKLPCGSDNPE